MPIIATNEGGSSFQPIEAGTYPARCIAMVHIGTITEDFQGKPKTLNKVRISWELPTEQKEFKEGEGDKPYVLSKEFTLSLHEKSTLRAFLKSWRGLDFTEDEAKAFDIEALIGVPCMLSVTHRESGNKTYADVSGVGKVIKGFTVPPQINKSMVLTYDNFSFEAFNTLPEFIRKKMESSIEFKKISDAVHGQQHQQATSQANDDLPF
jgi:hypothetical protein